MLVSSGRREVAARSKGVCLRLVSSGKLLTPESTRIIKDTLDFTSLWPFPAQQGAQHKFKENSKVRKSKSDSIHPLGRGERSVQHELSRELRPSQQNRSSSSIGRDLLSAWFCRCKAFLSLATYLPAFSLRSIGRDFIIIFGGVGRFKACDHCLDAPNFRQMLNVITNSASNTLCASQLGSLSLGKP